MSVSEGSAVRVSKVEGHVLVAVINGIELLAVKELGDVVLDNRILGNSSLLGPGCVKADDVSEGEDVFKFLALKGVLVDVDSSVSAGDAASDQLCVGPGWRVNVS